jgi:hypothetical protein
MRRLFFIGLLLCSLQPTWQTVWAEGVVHLAFSETFNTNTGNGGRDDAYSGSIAQNDIRYDIEGWSGSAVYGADKCLRIGTNNNPGTCTTPHIIFIGTEKTATLTFNAAGWGSGSNTLTITANEGVTLSGDLQITLANSEWKSYSVTITATDAESVQLTFTGKRGFLDDVKVEETVTAITPPTLPDNFYYWPNTTETASHPITLIPADSTTVYYTTDGTEPSTTNGHPATLSSSITITGTTTVNAIAYYKTVASDIVSKVYTVGETVNSIAAFNALPNNTEARLFLNDNANARVLHAHDGKQMYLRDNSGTICFDFGQVATFNPAPQHNQHVAGWIIGRKQTVDGLPKLVATANTTTDYLALAAPVTEPATEPTAVDDIADVNQHLGDWVSIQNVREGEGWLTVSNLFNAEHFTEVYDMSLVDVSGIITSYSTIAPVYYNSIRPVVYVIDENEFFHSPNNNIENATVRLKRTLGKGYWNTFVVPFAINEWEGEIRVCDDIQGNTMYFNEALGMEAGKPYLVKPYEDIKNPVFTDVELSATSAQSIDNGDYAFVGIYSPEELKTDKTMMFLKTDGKLYYPTATGTRLRGLRAYFKVPEGAFARLLIDDETDLADIERTENGEWAVKNAVYDLQGRKVSSLFTIPNSSSMPERSEKLKKGLYIVNGKRFVIH